MPSRLNEDADVIALLRAENSGYRKNFDQLKQAYQEQQLQMESLIAKLQLADNEKENIVQDHEAVVAEWRRQVAKQAAEFDMIKKQLIPTKNLTALKMECLLEYQEASKGKFDFMTEESKKWQKLFLEVTSDFERFKVQIHEKELAYQNTLEDMAFDHQQQLGVLQQKLMQKNDALDETLAIGIRLRELQKENVELQVKNRALIDEVGDLGNIISDDRANHQLHAQNLKRQISEKDSEIQNLFTLQKLGKKKSEQEEESLRKSSRIIDEIQMENTNLKSQLAKLTSGHEQITHQFNMERNDANFAFKKEQALMDQKLKASNSIISEKESVIDTLKQEVAEIQAQLIKTEQECSKRISTSTDEASHVEMSLREQLLQNERASSEKDKQFELQSKELHHQLENFKHMQNTLESTISALRLQNQALAASNSEIDSKLTQTTKQLDAATANMNSLADMVSKQESDINILRRKEESQSNRIIELQDELALNERRAQSTEEELGKQERKLRELLEQRESKIQELDKAYFEAKQNWSHQHVSNVDQTQKLVAAMKKMKQAYKQKSESQQQEIDEILAENEALKRGLENENHEAQLRMREMFKRQQDFANLLRTEGLISSGKKE